MTAMHFSLHPFIFSLLPLFLFLVFLLKWLSSTTTRPPHKNPPPSPQKLPIIGNLHQIGPFPHRSLHSLSQIHGPLMLLHFASAPVLVASSAAAAREIMKTHDLIFSNRPKSTIADKLMYASKDVAFSPYGEYWRQMKSIFVLQLLSNKRIQSFRHVREEETTNMIEKIRSSGSGAVNLSELIVELTGDVVCRVALGRKYGSVGSGGGGEGRRRRRGFKEVLGEFVELLGVFDVGDFVPWLKWVNRVNGVYGRVERLAKEFNGFLESVVEEHVGRERRGGEREGQDFVDVLLEIQRENSARIPVHRDSVKALILDAFAAGTDTTSTTLEWVMTELLKHPQVIKKLQGEVRGIVQPSHPITEDDLDQMPYLKAVIKETLRLHPPIPLLVPRESTKDVQVMGYDVAARTRVIVNAWSIGQDLESWDEPEKFRPERFLNSSVDFKGHDFELIPFGAGRRGCPGIQFSAAISELALANLVHKFDLALPDGVDLDVSEVAGLTIHKKFPLLLVATPDSC